MSKFETRAMEHLLYTTDKVELEAAFVKECDYCCTHSCRSCKQCNVKTCYEALSVGFEIRDIRRAKRLIC